MISVSQVLHPINICVRCNLIKYIYDSNKGEFFKINIKINKHMIVIF